MRKTISAIIIARNEEKNIRGCLESVKWCDEIVVIDSGSVDKTVEIAKEFTDKVIFKEWEGYAKQKQYSLDTATSEWAVSLDADERLSAELSLEIQEILNKDVEEAGFELPRLNHFLGKPIKTCHWYPDYKLRLMRKSKASVTDRKVHEGFVVDGKIGRCRGELIHFTHDSVFDAIEKINNYSSLAAEETAYKKNVKPYRMIIHPIAAFLTHFFSRKGYKDGVYGLMISINHSVATALRYMKLWELQNVKNEKDKT